MNKDEAVQELVQWHFEVGPRTTDIYRFIADNEDQPEEPIKLMEVSELSPETGRVDAFGFGPAEDFPYSSIVAQVTSRELEQIKAGQLRLPDGWNLAASQLFHNNNNSYA